MLFGTGNWTGKPAPEIQKGEWVGSQPLTLKQLQGKVVLVDFWEYSCINCIRTLPYLKSWYERYHQYGLEIIGVHVPEFEFGKQRSNVEEAIAKYGITWPVVLDNEYKTWNAYNNNVWPRELLIDQKGVVVHDQSGEGGYQETEARIQELLKGNSLESSFPKVMDFVRETDHPGRACFRTSPELYAGMERGKLGNPEGFGQGASVDYAEPQQLEEDVIYVSGKWQAHPQHLQRAAGVDGKAGWLGLTYHAKGVYAVIKPEGGPSGFKVWVEQDGKPLSREAAGEDIVHEGDGSFFIVDSARMYRLVNNPEFGVHTLKLFPESDSFAFYTFTFETACQ